MRQGGDIQLWHKRIDHINFQRLQGMQSKGVTIRLPAFEMEQVDWVCKASQLGKQKFPKERNVSKGHLDVIHSHIWGPAKTPTIGGCWYYVTFIINYSHYTWIFPMKKKSEVLSHFQKIKSQVEKETSHPFTVTNTPSGDYDRAWMTRIRRSDEARNLRWGMTQEHKDKYQDHDNKMGQDEKTRLIWPWLAFNPLKGTTEVTSIYTMSRSTCIRIFWRIFERIF